MCVIRPLLSYLCGIICDRVRKQGLRSTHKMRKPEEGIVIQNGDFSLCELFITMRPLWRRWPCATNYQESPSGNRGGRLSHFHYKPSLLVTIRGPWWITHQERRYKGPGLKESIKKMHRAGEVSGMMANVRLYHAAANSQYVGGRQGSLRHSIIITLKY